MSFTDLLIKLARFTAWAAGCCISSELIGYWLHRLLHSGKVRFLAQSHMTHHLVQYGPAQHMRPSPEYLDATAGRVSLGNIGLEWLAPAGLILGTFLLTFQLLSVPWLYQAVFVGVTLAWSFVMFSYLHDRMHQKGFWMERNPALRRWFLAARKLHDIHHRSLNDDGKMDKNFGIGFFLFDRLFGTSAWKQGPFNRGGYEAAKRRNGLILN
jgi:sterol desaturase/sphingolipid hydroxylase (fatty acid hydroxylase superfamily)